MINSIGAIALALNMNTADVSISAYKSMLAEGGTQQSNTINKEQDFSLNAEQKVHLKTLNNENFEVLQQYKNKNEEVFKRNFDRWVIQDSESVKSLVNEILEMSNEFSSEFKKEAKYYTRYPSLSKQLIDTANLWNNIHEFTSKFKARANEANEAYSFMSKFIPQNKEVLEALA